MKINEILLIFFFTFTITYFLVPINIWFSKRFHLIDSPHDRGIHHDTIPLAGGLSFAIPIILLQIIFIFIKYEYKEQFLTLVLGNLLILGLGYFDDKRKFTAKYKLIIQILIVTLVYFLGFRIILLTNPFGLEINLGFLSLPITVIWFLIVINAFNLIDGIDGLAIGIALITVTVLFSVGLVYSNELIILLSIGFIGSSLAFLRYNFYPAKIFMGDTGSLFIGFNIAAISIFGASQYKGITTMTLLIPITVLIVPISDTIMTILRRIKRKKNIFQADKEHLHHKMLDLGFSQKTIALICYFITFLFGLIAFGFSFASKEVLLGILTLLLLILIILILLLLKRGR